MADVNKVEYMKVTPHVPDEELDLNLAPEDWEKLQIARMEAVALMPYLATSIYALENVVARIETPTVLTDENGNPVLDPITKKEIPMVMPTMASDPGYRLYMDPRFVKEIDVKSLSGVYLHEAFHILFTHNERAVAFLRQLGLNLERFFLLANIAMDMEINDNLAEANIVPFSVKEKKGRGCILPSDFNLKDKDFFEAYFLDVLEDQKKLTQAANAEKNNISKKDLEKNLKTIDDLLSLAKTLEQIRNRVDDLKEAMEQAKTAEDLAAEEKIAKELQAANQKLADALKDMGVNVPTPGQQSPQGGQQQQGGQSQAEKQAQAEELNKMTNALEALSELEKASTQLDTGESSEQTANDIQAATQKLKEALGDKSQVQTPGATSLNDALSQLQNATEEVKNAVSNPEWKAGCENLSSAINEEMTNSPDQMGRPAPGEGQPSFAQTGQPSPGEGQSSPAQTGQPSPGGGQSSPAQTGQPGAGEGQPSPSMSGGQSSPAQMGQPSLGEGQPSSAQMGQPGAGAGTPGASDKMQDAISQMKKSLMEELKQQMAQNSANQQIGQGMSDLNNLGQAMSDMNPSSEWKEGANKVSGGAQQASQGLEGGNQQSTQNGLGELSNGLEELGNGIQNAVNELAQGNGTPSGLSSKDADDINKQFAEILKKHGLSNVTPCGSSAHGQKMPWELDDNDLEHAAKTEGQKELIKREVAEAILEAERDQNSSKSRGTVPAFLKTWADNVLDSKVPWEKLFRSTIRRGLGSIAIGKEAPTYSKMSRRGGGDFIQPGAYKFEPSLAIVVDTSGSMGGDEIGQALGEIKSIIKKVGIQDVTVISCDADVNAVSKAVHSLNDIELNGGGGTDMRVGIEYALTKLNPKPDGIIVMTDGYTPWPDHITGRIPLIATVFGKGADNDGLLADIPNYIKKVYVDTEEMSKSREKKVKTPSGAGFGI